MEVEYPDAFELYEYEAYERTHGLMAGTRALVAAVLEPESHSTAPSVHSTASYAQPAQNVVIQQAPERPKFNLKRFSGYMRTENKEHKS